MYCADLMNVQGLLLCFGCVCVCVCVCLIGEVAGKRKFCRTRLGSGKDGRRSRKGCT